MTCLHKERGPTIDNENGCAAMIHKMAIGQMTFGRKVKWPTDCSHGAAPVIFVLSTFSIDDNNLVSML